MSSRWKLVTAVLMLVLLGGGLAFYKSTKLGVPFWEGQRVDEWLVEARVSFLAVGKPVKARLSLPANGLDESAGQEAGSLGYHYHVDHDRGESTAIWSSEMRENGQALYFRVRFPLGSESGGGPIPPTGSIPVAEAPGLSGSVGEAARNIVARSKAISSDADSLFVTFFRQIENAAPSQEMVLINRAYEKEYHDDAPIKIGIDLLALAGVPARVAYGVKLDDRERETAQGPLPLVEYFDGANWKVRDPLAPTDVLDGSKVFVWHRGGGPLLDVTGGENSRVSFTVVKDRIPLARLTDLQNSPILVSTILGLPASERAVFRYIVLIPLGAFVVVLMRNIVGIPTLGTFMPVLLALALLEMPVGPGLVMFAILVAAGLWCRFLLSRLNLLVVPRVAACVVIVTLLMMYMTVLSHRIGVGIAVEIMLFPMIIIAWTIERMSLIWEEEGKRSAITQVGGSVLVAVLAYSFMCVSQIRYWAFYFPETLLILLAGILIIGRYTGYRISELFRFRSFTED
ncbi:UUP1 family membrane protein [Luteolibacter pohnpeiensis]|uniref:UUP1 family membrane protein n=1 Tax=Luteolibacter pohnpeiensis TaxID=454153 RepID=A0A934S801_9BACT|nr:UUP1 family membrane protein [Luteolibacter pohnpeiensis]MBK1882990.1 UUP1 family membrane protein [Luteolibacter pohnpeiensis]